MPTQVRADVYTRVTEAILAAIEAGTGNWRMPWHHSGADVTRPTNIASGKPYRGINTLLVEKIKGGQSKRITLDNVLITRESTGPVK